MKKHLLLALAALLVTTQAHAQASISEGMTADQVHAAFGAPATVRCVGPWSYWYYHNGCPQRCGSDDVVFFRDGRVVAAVLRTSARRFSGPAANRALEAAGSTEQDGAYLDPRDGPPVTVGGVRVESRPAAPVIVVEGETRP